MAELNFKKIGEDMLNAMKGVLKEHFAQARDIADDELEDFAKRTAELSRKVLEGKINEAQAKAILKIRQNALETVILSIAGIGLLAAQEAINAAIKILKEALGTAFPGISLL